MGMFGWGKRQDREISSAEIEKDLIAVEKPLARMYLLKSPHPLDFRRAEERYLYVVGKHYPKADATRLLSALYLDYDGYYQSAATKDWGDGTSMLFVKEQDAVGCAKGLPEYEEQLRLQYPWLYRSDNGKPQN
ncbi:hypothetical protein [Paraburkholderia kirstenboschensis]|uniref:Uncharacterized protein n=1 Tax=Paraburkholderia kirstenboschensis TaxID=1245436 RepID=A0ABZ0EAH1_9BURK|nr:hypothetical protein [Paraburkholderia kirstenboschensis]WOD14233.1 hypothetical protein RW095_01605 [Paraburkholderia kirstenboschensis]